MATSLSNALPLTGADGISGRNNGRDIRKGLLSSVLLPDTKANPLAVRNGVLPHDYDAAGVKSLRVDQTAIASNQVILQPGPFVCERTGQGPYLGWLETSAGVLITPPASDATNPRIDMVYVQVLDKASISPDPSTDPIVDVVPGVPSATPVVPVVTADGAVVLARLYRPAGSTTITQANITDVRRSSGLVGTVRRLLPGDFLSDLGKVDGELRYRQAVGSLPSLVDYWDAVRGVWRGTQGFVLTGNWPGVTAGTTVSGTTVTWPNVYGLGYAPIQVNIPDPGWPYTVAASVNFYVSGINGAGGLNSYVNVNSNQFAGSYSYANTPQNVVIVPVGDTIFTGASTAALHWDVPINGVQVACTADTRNTMKIRIDPA